MRWDDFRRSDNVEDSRGDEGGGFGGGGGMGIPIGGGGLGIGTVIIIGLIGWALGIDPSILIGGAEIVNSGKHHEQPYQPPARQTTGKPGDQMGDFVAAVLGNTEDTWKEIFAKSGQQYSVPRLRLYSGAIQGGCGFAQAAMGPFYCPNDRRIYLDTSFFRDIQARFRGCSGKACEFAEAYVIAHEVGHHVQNLLGILPKVQSAQRSAGSKVEANRIQVRVELQADCLAGVWANHAVDTGYLQPLTEADIAQGLDAAAAVGDDRIQKQTQGRVNPETWTHGSSAQRQAWFLNGYRGGNLGNCDTFSGAI